ncbi:TetR family transcriptional regulator [Saccharopolyspora sp. 5N708]|uniref:TetR family transcriptional regulator n=1 Tax=Saccharopolyspora sp. 5N708 TaxID=3457424 RepID=UPI003FD60BD1
MSSARSDDSPAADLTAQAKIRNAAIAHFGRDGFQKTNLRAIAAAAGVSVGLIFHHFGSKEGLLRACDEHVLRVLTNRARAAGRPAGAGLQDLHGEYLANPEEYRLQAQYMARAIAEDTPAANTFVTAMVAESEAIFRAGAADGTMRRSSDPRGLAVLNILISQAVLTMPPPLARALGQERFGPDVLRRLALPTLELYTHGLYTDDAPLKAAQDAWAAARPPQQEKD